MLNPSLKKQIWYYLNRTWVDKGYLTIPKGVNSKVNVIGQLEFELVLHEVVVQHVSHYAMRTSWVFDGKYGIIEIKGANGNIVVEPC